jgi:hypothetical protein
MRKLVISLLVLTSISCDRISKNDYANKKLIATCQENQGIVTFETFLYGDSTFYQEGNDLIKKSYGTFSLTLTGINFKTIGGQQNLCNNYKFDSSRQILLPIDNSSDHLNIYFEKQK